VEALLVSIGVVALAEIGDKTQLLALLLATRFHKPVPIVLGIFVATLANHAGASAIGSWLFDVVGAGAMRWILALSFFAMAAWALIPDSAPDESSTTPRYGVFLTTVIAFFLVEMGDKTQIATVALAAQFHSIGGTRHHARHAASQRAGGLSWRRADQARADQMGARVRRALFRRARDLFAVVQAGAGALVRQH
jgi:putative Ca2+/H+ antiporter (TMEM165/GDT1 family)